MNFSRPVFSSVDVPKDNLTLTRSHTILFFVFYIFNFFKLRTSDVLALARYFKGKSYKYSFNEGTFSKRN